VKAVEVTEGEVRAVVLEGLVRVDAARSVEGGLLVAEGRRVVRYEIDEEKVLVRVGEIEVRDGITGSIGKLSWMEVLGKEYVI